ncbi:MAG: hypothetical protein IKX11_02740 [Bacteroidales bacterium]|nr:hypothetical protein [Bacteroidales bacterium]
MQPQRYIKLILPLRLEWEPCYSTAAELAIGERVAVVFAHKRVIGVVSETDVTPDIDPSRIHSVLGVETGLEKISPEEISLWRFMAEYYLCSIGEVYKAAYPSLKTHSEESSARAQQRKEALEELTLRRWQDRLHKLQARLEAKEKALAGRHSEAVRLRLEEQRNEIASQMQAAQDKLASLSSGLGMAEKDYSSLIAGIKAPAISKVLKDSLSTGKPLLLKSADRAASYVSAAAQCLRKGRNVFIMVNETALATRLQERLEDAFGSLLLVHHSQQTHAARRRINDSVRSGRPYVLIGTRSSLFVPHRDLGLIIVENEESPFYKQSDTAPRYNARDCAVQLARIHGCSLILGSCSPSLESLLNARSGRYSLLDMNPDGRETHPGCRFTLIDVQAEKRKNGMDGVFSLKLLSEMKYSPKTAIIRGYEKEEDLAGTDADIFSIPQAAKQDLSGYSLVAMLSADALFDPSDFRSDEHAFQYLERLRGSCPKVTVQTSQAGHQVYSLSSAAPLLEERRRFGLPPYTRLVDIRFKDASAAASLAQSLASGGFSAMALGETVRVSIPRDRQLLERKKELRRCLEAFRSSSKAAFVVDVDPI